MIIKNRLKRLTILFICISIFLSSTQVLAEKPTVDIEDGILTFITVDRKATSNITWKTVGFTVCRQNTGGYPRQDTDGNPNTIDYAVINLDDNQKVERDIGNGQVEVTFKVTEEQINKAFQANELDKIKDNDLIYLNGIFQVLHGGQTLSKKYYNWRGEFGIADAEAWASGPEDFRDHFNIPVIYETTYTYPITIESWIYNSSSSNTKYDTVNYQEQKKNTTFKTDSSKIKTSIIQNKETYYLYRVYYVNLRKSGTQVDNRKIETNPYVSMPQYENDIKYLRDREYTIKDKGLKIVALYRRFKQYDPSVKEETMERDFEIVDPTAVIAADTRGDEQYDVTQGIPGTEALYTNAFTNKYLSAYHFTRKYGTKVYNVKVNKTYHLKWKTSTTVTDPITKEETVIMEEHTEVEMVPKTYILERNYSYWTIDSLAVYGLDKAIINNDALAGGNVNLSPMGYSVPTVNYSHRADEEDHITEPEIEEINMPEQTIMGSGSKPTIPSEDFKAEAEDSVKKIKCKNDRLIFDGQEIMSDEEMEEKTVKPLDIPEGQEEINQNVLYRSNIVIPGTMANGEYETTGVVIYKPIIEFNNQADTTYEIYGINSVVVHTPTVCDAQVQNNYQDNQMITPDVSRASIVLDRPFYVTLPTTGNHQYYPGYGYKDYAKYITSKQVNFPFDTYRGSSVSGTFIPANTWTSVEENTQFFLPTWVNEGNYTINFRSTAINAYANNKTSYTETLANLELNNYVATDTVNVQVSGRIYGLNIYDISDYPLWKNVFRLPDSLKLTGFRYTVGTQDQNGNNNGQNKKYTLSLVNGVHPQFQNVGVLKTGYVTRFSLKTIGNMYGSNDYIRITPTFYYVDKDGNNRQEVDIYYSETFNGKMNLMVKMGSELDLQNKKAFYTNDPYLSIPEGALKQTAFYKGIPLKDWLAQKRNVFTFTNIMIPESLRTFVGYIPYVPIGVTEKMVVQSVQNWYGEYYLPSEIYVAPKGFDIIEYWREKGGFTYKEPFWLKGGYVVVNFSIETIQEGRRHLSYINPTNSPYGYLNMWKREGYQYEKTDYNGVNFQFIDGDYVLYHTDRSAAKDYISSGTH